MNVNESVSVTLVNNIPKKVVWKGRNYSITKIGLHHTYKKGRTLYHIFSVNSGLLFLRLKLNSENLFWKLEGVDSGI